MDIGVGLTKTKKGKRKNNNNNLEHTWSGLFQLHKYHVELNWTENISDEFAS